MAEIKKPLQILYESLLSDNYDVPDNYESFERTLTAPGVEGVNNRMTLYKSLRDNDYDVPDNYKSFANTLFVPKQTAAQPKQVATPQQVQAQPKQQVVAAQMPTSGNKLLDDSLKKQTVAPAVAAPHTTPFKIEPQKTDDQRTNDLLNHNWEDNGDKAYHPDKMAQAAFDNQVAAIQTNMDNLSKEFDERQKNIEAYRNSGASLSANSAQVGYKYDKTTNTLKPTYTDFLGNSYDNKEQAEEFGRYVRQQASRTVEDDIRDAEKELAELEEKRKQEQQEKAKGGEKGAAISMYNSNSGLFNLGAKLHPSSITTSYDSAIDSVKERIEYLKNNQHEGKRENLINTDNIENSTAKTVSNWVNNAYNFADSYRRGVYGTAAKLKTWDFGYNDVKNSLQMMTIKDKLDKGIELTDGEKAYVKSVTSLNSTRGRYGELSTGHRWGEIAGMSLPFMLQFFMTGGFDGIVGTTEKLITKGLETGASKFGMSGLTNALARGSASQLGKQLARQGFVKFVKSEGIAGVGALLKEQALPMTIKTLGVTSDGLMRSAAMAGTVQLPKTTSDIINKHLGELTYDYNKGHYEFKGGQGWVKSAWQAAMDDIIENFSEMTGEYLPGIIGMSKHMGMRKLSAMLLNSTREGAQGVMATTTKLMRKMAINGYFGEVGEEYMGQAMRSVLGLDSAYDGNGVNNFMSSRFHWDTWGGMLFSVGGTGLVTGAGVKGASMLSDGYNYLRAKKEMDRTDRYADAAIGTEMWDKMRAVIDYCPNENIGDVAASIFGDKNMSKTQQDAALDYIAALMMQRGLNYSQMLARQSKKMAADDYDATASYLGGYNITGHVMMNEASNRYDNARARLVNELSSLGEEAQTVLDNIDSDPIGAIRKSHDEGFRELVTEYVNSKMRYEGMLQRVRDDIDSQIAANDARIDSRTNNATQRVVKAKTKDDAEVYVIDGNVEMMMSDGTMVDKSKSDSSIIVKDAISGDVKMIDVNDIMSITGSADAAELKKYGAEQIRQQMAQEAADKINATLNINPGEMVTISDSMGGLVDINIVGASVDANGNPIQGSARVRYADGTEEDVAMDVLQQLYKEGVDIQAQQQTTQQPTQTTEPQQPAQAYNVGDVVTLHNDDGTTATVRVERSNDDTQYLYTILDADGKEVGVETMPKDEFEQMAQQPEATTETPTEQVDSKLEQPLEQPSVQVDAQVEQPSAAASEEVPAVEQPQPTATERVPKDDKGNPIYEQADADTAYDAIVEQTGGDVDLADKVIAAKIEAYKKEVEKAQKAITKPINLKADAPLQEYMAEGQKRQKALADAQAAYDAWQKIAAVPQQRKTEAERQQQEAERQEAAQEANDADIAAQTRPSEQEIDSAERADADERADIERDTQDAADEATRPSEQEIDEAERQSDIENGKADDTTTDPQQRKNEKEKDELRPIAEEEWKRAYNSQKNHAKQSINDKAELELLHNATVDEINERLDKLRKAGTDKDALIDEIMSRTDIDKFEKFGLIANAARNAAAASSYIPVLEKELERRGAEPQPTEAQIAAGNYKKGHVKIDGYDITIENPKGSVRRGKDSNGTAWEIEMQNDYGYIRRTEGVDGDHIDIFLSGNPKSGDVFVVDQVNPNTGEFDEHKVMYGFPNEEAARVAYLSNYSKGWNGLGKITRVSKEEFKKWIDSSHRKTKPFAEYRSVTPIENSVIGRSLSEHEATELIKQMEANAEIALILDLTAKNWGMEFGEDGTVDTPLGIVKMGGNQMAKLIANKRTGYFGMIKPTLERPDMVIEKQSIEDGAERSTKYLFIKTFVKPDGSRVVHFESVTVRKDEKEVSISSHEVNAKSIKKEVQNSKILYLNDKLSLGSEGYLTETPNERPDLVPTSDNSKGSTKSAEKQEDDVKVLFREVDEDGGDGVGIDVQAAIDSMQMRGVTVVNSVDELDQSSAAYREITSGNGIVKGWFDIRSGRVYIYAPSITSIDDLMETLRHEGVAHMGLRELVGKEGFGELCNRVWYQAMTAAQRKKFICYVYGISEAEYDKLSLVDKMRMFGDEEKCRAAADEYMAHMAESGSYNEMSGWAKVKAWVREMLRNLGIDLEVSDNDVLKLLRRSESNLKNVDAQGSVGSSDDVRFRMTRSKADFEAMQKRAEKERGLVMPGLNEAEVTITEVPRHDFKGSGKQALIAAEAWAKKHIVGTHKAKDSDGNVFRYYISNDSVEKYVSKSTTDKSDNIGVHLAVLKELPKVIGESIEAEVHASYKKDANGVRRIEAGVNDAELVHRFYGAISIKGENGIYRVKTTMIEHKDAEHATAPHSYEVTKIEVLPDESESTSNGAAGSTSSREGILRTAKLLKGVEKSYDNGVKLLEKSEPKSEDIRMRTVGDDAEANDKKLYNPRSNITPVRGEWTESKIKTRLKEIGGSQVGVKAAARIISEFDSPEELAEHMFYHGTVYGGGHLRPSILMSDREIERIGGGGYGEKYWGISVSKSKRIASNFSGTSNNVRILPIVLAKGAKVIEMPELQDASDLDRHITQLWKEGIDAVWIGNRNSKHSEQELCVLNPKAIVNIDTADFYNVFGLGSEKNPLRIIDEEGVKNLYDAAKQFNQKMKDKPNKPVKPSRFIYDENGDLEHKDADTYEREMAEYDNALKEYESSVAYTEYQQAEHDAYNAIRFRSVGDLNAINDRFNTELQQQIDGKLPQGHIYQLGNPSAILRSAGFPNMPIELSSTKLAEKSAQRNHEFSIEDVKDLPNALQHPLAVFAYGDKTKAENVIVELERDGKKFVVGVHFNQIRNGIEVSSIRGLFNKNNAEWLNWISQGKSEYLNKEKIQALIDKQRTNLADVEYLDLDGITKIIENFENPKLLSEPNSDSGDIRFRKADTKRLPKEPRPLNANDPTTPTEVDAKVLNNVQRLKDFYVKNSNNKSSKGLISNITLALGLQGNSSRYGSFVAENGKEFTLRVSNHRGKVSTFDAHGESEGISIVVETSPKGKLINDGEAHVIEYKYKKRDLDNADSNAYVSILESIEDMMHTGEYNDKTGLAEVTEANGEDTRFRFIGERGAKRLDAAEEASTRLDNLAVARAMEESGKDAKSVKMATGWERGADGKWRYETADVKRIDRHGNLHPERYCLTPEENKELEESEYEAFKAFRMGDKVFQEQGKIIDEDTNMADIYIAGGMEPERAYRYAALVKKEYDLEKMPKSLDDYIDDDALFEAYPELRNIKIEAGDPTAVLYGLSGSYNKETNTITLYSFGKDVVVHEIQHAIQDIEGFAQGGSKRTAVPKQVMLQKLNATVERRKAELADVNSRIEEVEKDLDIIEQQFGNNKIGEEEYIAKKGNLEAEYDVLLKKVQDVAQELNTAEIRQRLTSKRSGETVLLGRDGYYELAGEVEARNVSNRIDMSDEQRRESLVSDTEDVAREDQIFLMDNLGKSAMGSKVPRRMKEIAERLENADLDERQKAVVDVFTGKADNQKIDVLREDGKRTIIMRQGSESGAGTKHSLYRHYGTGVGVINAEDLTLIPKVLEEGKRVPYKDSKVRKSYTLTVDGVEYTVATDMIGGTEKFVNFYTNRKLTIQPESKSSKELNTSNDATRSIDSSDIAKVDNNSETHKINIGASFEVGANAQTEAMNVKQKTGEVREDIRFRLSRNNRQTVSSWLNKREDLTVAERQSVLDYLDTLDDATTQLAAGKWFVQGTVRLPEDMDKIEQAVAVAKKAKVDVMRYKSPMEVIESHADIKIKAKPINPDTVSTLTNKREIGNGITIYDVEDSKQGQADMRKIINTHFGEECSPWCLLQGDGNGNLREDSWEYWNHYNAYPKQVAFKDGKLTSFSASDSKQEQWWDKQDAPHDGVPVIGKVKGDEKGRTGTLVYSSKSGELIGAEDLHNGNKMSGTYEEWYDLDTLKKREERYTNDKGEFVEDFTNYRKDGSVGAKILYVDGTPIYDRSYYGNGDVYVDVTYNGNFGDYSEKRYYENGQLESSTQIKDGKYDGLQIEFYKNGQPKKEVLWQKNNGYRKLWHENGQLSYYKDKNTGEEKKWYSDGKLTYHKQSFGGIVIEEMFGPGKEYRGSWYDPMSSPSSDYYSFESDMVDWMAEHGIKDERVKARKSSSEFGSIMDMAEKVFAQQQEKQRQQELDTLFRKVSASPRDRAAAVGAYERVVSSSSFQMGEAFHDSMLGLKRMYEAIDGTNRRIEDYADYENAYLFENRMSSMNAAQIYEYRTRFIDPLMEEVYKLTGKEAKPREELAHYMIAKHGLERNVVLAERDTKRAEEEAKAAGLAFNYAAVLAENRKRDYSGLTGLFGERNVADAEAKAQDFVDQYEADHDTRDFWDKLNAATEDTLHTIYDSGMISEDTYNTLRSQFAYYVPLQGFDETTSDEVYGYLNERDATMTGSPIKTAKGRSSVADDPLVFIRLAADKAIQMANRNRMKQRALNFVLNHPSDLVSVQSLWLYYNVAEKRWQPIFPDITPDMTPEEVEQTIADFEADMEAQRKKYPDTIKRGYETANIPYKVLDANKNEHIAMVKRNGVTTLMIINGNPRAAQALNGMTNPDAVTNPIMRAAMWMNRKLSQLYTTLNPDFVVSNFIRDTVFANTMVWAKESPKYATSFHYNCLKYNPGTMGYLFNKWNNGTLNKKSNLELEFYNFMRNGGETGWTALTSVEHHRKSIDKQLKEIDSRVRKGLSIIGEQYETVNRAVENMARFAAYMTSRQMGRSVERSATDAKEITVNFNRKGAGYKTFGLQGQTFLGNAASLVSGTGRITLVFWNAGIQGLMNVARTSKRNPIPMMMCAAALFGLGFTLSMFGRGRGDDDDETKYDDLPPYVRRSNICFRCGNSFIKIPLPVEYRAMYGLGELASSVISGSEQYDDGELAYQIASQVSQVLPLDFLEGGGGVNAFMPSSIKPLVEAWENKGWTGMPIYSDSEKYKYDPDWQKAFKSTNKQLVEMTKWLNEHSGGDDYTKGKINLNPAVMEYLLNGYLGGLYTFPAKLVKTSETIFGDREFEWKNTPILNRVVYGGDETTNKRSDTKQYYDFIDEAKETSHRIKGYEAEKEKGIMAYAEKLDFLNNSEEHKRWVVAQCFEKNIANVKKAMDAATDEIDKQQLKAEYYELMHEAVEAFKNPDAYFKQINEQLKAQGIDVELK